MGGEPDKLLRGKKPLPKWLLLVCVWLQMAATIHLAAPFSVLGRESYVACLPGGRAVGLLQLALVPVLADRSAAAAGQKRWCSLDQKQVLIKSAAIVLD